MPVLRRVTAPVLLVGLAIALTVSAGPPASAAATTADSQGGLWYYKAFGVADANAAGADGTGVKMAVLDTQINASWPALAGADITIHEPSFCGDRDGTGAAAPATSTEYNSAQHGTDMTSLIVGNGTGPNGEKGPLGVAPKAHILYYATDYAAYPDIPLSQGGNQSACPPAGVTAQKSLDPDLSASSLGDGFAKALNQAVADGASIVTYATVTRATDAVKTAVALPSMPGS